MSAAPSVRGPDISGTGPSPDGETATAENPGNMKTECESGNGRTDIIMRPKDGGTVPMIFELKRSASEEDLEADADGAMSQIHERKYYMGMKGRVVLFGISFWVKVPKVKVEIVEI